MQELIDWLESHNIQISGVVLNIVVAIIIIFAGFIIGKIIGRLIKRLLHEAEVDNVLRKIGIRFSFEKIAYILIEYFIYIVAIVMALNQLGVTTTVLQIILGGIAIMVILFVLISIKDFVPNMIAGYFMQKKQIVKKGDMIKVQNTAGKVENVGLVETEVITKNKDKIFIPNSTMVRSELAVKKRKR